MKCIRWKRVIVNLPDLSVFHMKTIDSECHNLSAALENYVPSSLFNSHSLYSVTLMSFWIFTAKAACSCRVKFTAFVLC